MKVDITKREQLNALLSNLTENRQAEWGIMKPQNMIEHLAKTLQFSNGKREIAQRATEDEAKVAKQVLIYTDAEIAKGLKSAMAGEVPDPFEFTDLDEAIKRLNKELDDFETHFAHNPDATYIQPRLGKLDNKEWIIFHSKHFTHHFKQFGLLTANLKE